MANVRQQLQNNANIARQQEDEPASACLETNFYREHHAHEA